MLVGFPCSAGDWSTKSNRLANDVGCTSAVSAAVLWLISVPAVCVIGLSGVRDPGPLAATVAKCLT